jgi:adenosylcobinamide kinase/adenosylcobinamide-phosphate guanylyltransferase
VNALTFLIGGARSGKSDLAVEIGRRFNGDVTFIATAQPFDDDMRKRISRHQADRPNWPTIEAPTDLEAALIAVPANNLVIIDCLTVWLANLVVDGRSEPDVIAAARRAAQTAAERSAPTVVITNEVGLGIHPETDLGRDYRDLLGRINRIWADAADQSLFLIAGRAIALHDPWELLS